MDEDGYTTHDWRVLETYGRYRIVINHSGGYEVHRQHRRKWYRVGTSTAFYDVASRKMSRLLGHRDTDTPIGEWMRYYGVGTKPPEPV